MISIHECEEFEEGITERISEDFFNFDKYYMNDAIDMVGEADLENPLILKGLEKDAVRFIETMDSLQRMSISFGRKDLMNDYLKRI